MSRTRAGVAGLAAYVRPPFLLPAVGMSASGAVLAPASAFDPFGFLLHAGTVGLALFVAHLRDGYVDGHLRGEEAPHLSAAALRWSVRVGSGAVLVLAGVFLALWGVLPALSAVVLLGLAVLHAPYLDRHPVTATVDYPVGIGVAFLGGYAAQTGDVSMLLVAVATAFVALLAGIKVGIDRLDVSFDRSIDKRTVPVAFGPAGADRVAAALFVAAAVLSAGIGVAGVAGVADVARPAFAVAAGTVPFGCLAATWTTPERAVRLRMGLTYLFAACLLGAVCAERCAALAIGVSVLGG